MRCLESEGHVLSTKRQGQGGKDRPCQLPALPQLYFVHGVMCMVAACGKFKSCYIIRRQHRCTSHGFWCPHGHPVLRLCRPMRYCSTFNMWFKSNYRNNHTYMGLASPNTSKLQSSKRHGHMALLMSIISYEFVASTMASMARPMRD